jgi:hypothetical protein
MWNATGSLFASLALLAACAAPAAPRAEPAPSLAPTGPEPGVEDCVMPTAALSGVVGPLCVPEHPLDPILAATRTGALRALGADVVVDDRGPAGAGRANANAYARLATSAVLPADAIVAHAAALIRYQDTGDALAERHQASQLLDRYGRGALRDDVVDPALTDAPWATAPGAGLTPSERDTLRFYAAAAQWVELRALGQQAAAVPIEATTDSLPALMAAISQRQTAVERVARAAAALRAWGEDTWVGPADAVVAITYRAFHEDVLALPGPDIDACAATVGGDRALCEEVHGQWQRALETVYEPIAREAENQAAAACSRAARRTLHPDVVALVSAVLATDANPAPCATTTSQTSAPPLPSQ